MHRPSLSVVGVRVLLPAILLLPIAAASPTTAHTSGGLIATNVDTWTDGAGDTHVTGLIENHTTARRANIQVTATWASPVASESGTAFVTDLAPHASSPFHVVEEDTDVSAAGDPTVTASSSSVGATPAGGLHLEVDGAALVGDTYTINITNDSTVAGADIVVWALRTDGAANDAAGSAPIDLAAGANADFSIAFDDESDGSTVTAVVAMTTAGTLLVSWSNYFGDLGTSNFAAEIAEMADMDITTGCGNANYCPKGVVTRAQMAAFLDRAIDFDNEAAPDQGFEDTGHLSPSFQQAINNLALAGVTGGCSIDPKRYCPGDTVTRGQMSKFIVTAYELGDPVETDQFTDDDGHFSEPYNDRMAELGITSGCATDPARYCPFNPVLREQMAVFIVRAELLPADVNDAPVLAVTGSTPSYTEGGSPVTVEGNLTIFDDDSPTLVSGVVSVTGGLVAGDTLTFTPGATGISDTDASASVLALSGVASRADWQTVLRSVQFSSSSDNPTDATRTVSFTVNDGELDSNAAQKNVTVVLAGEAPVVDASVGSTPFTEGGAPVAIDPAVSVTDVDGGNLASARVQLTGGCQSGQDVLALGSPPAGITVAAYVPATCTLDLTGPASIAAFQTALRAVTYTNTSDNPSTADRTATFSVNDGALSGSDSRTITVAAVNDVPVITLSGTTPSFTEDGPAVTVDGGLTVTDPDDTNLESGSVTISAGGQTGDALTFTPGTSGITDTNPAADILALTGTATVADWQTVLRSVQFATTNQNPTTSRTIRFVVNDGTATSTNADKTVTVVPVGEAPVLTQPDATGLTYTENAAATVIAPNITAADVDSPTLAGATIDIGTGYANGQDVLSLGTNPQNGITAAAFNASTGTLTLSGTSSVANYQAALRDVRYINGSDDPSTAARTVTFQVSDGSDSSNTVSRNVAVTAVNDAPVADDETFSGASGAVGNTTLAVNDPSDGAPPTPDPTDTSPVTDRPHKSISGDILSGDTDADGPALAVMAGTFATNDGGTVTLQADGDFTFEPAPSTSCADTSDFFDYTLRDSGSPEQTDVGRVTIGISGCVWYVNNDDGQGNSGTAERPFDTLAQAEIASGGGHSIFVYDGNNTTSGYAAGITLKGSQRLIGEAAALTVGSDTLHSPDAANKPTIADTHADVVELDDGNEVRGLIIDPAGTGGGIAGASGDNGGTIDDVDIIDTGTQAAQPGLELDFTTGTYTISNLTVSTSGAIGLRLNNAGLVTVTGSANTLATTTGTALDVANTTIGAAGLTFRSISSNGAVNGIVLNTTGSNAGLTVTGTDSAGSGGTIQSSAGAGIMLTSTLAPSFSFISVTSGADDGIRGSAVAGFTLASSSVTNNGNGAGESGLEFVNLTGTASVSSSTISGSPENGMIVTNSGVSLTLTVNESTLNSASTASTGNDGLHLDANNGASMTVGVHGSTFSDNRGDHFHFATNAVGAGTNSVTFSNNTLTGDRGLGHGGTDIGAGILIVPDGASDTTYTISQNNIQGAVSNPIAVAPAPTSLAASLTSGTVSGNTIGDAAVTASGGSQSSAIAVIGQGAGTLTAAITNNTIRQNNGFAGIDILSRDGSPTLSVTVTGNSVANPSVGGGNGLLLRSGATATDAGFTCAAITDNTLAGSAAVLFDDFRLRQRFGTTVRLPGYAGTAGDTAAVVAFVQGNNPGAETGSATADFPITGGGFLNSSPPGSPCPQP